MTSEIISADENQPELSIVCATRNDDHGGDLLKRMRLCFNGIFKLAERHKLICELIVVEWNPPDHKPKLQEVLPWPEEHKYCSVRVIEVPNGIHQRYKHSKNLPLYQMIAKNVGIRRARGRMVLATNVDILFTDALFEFFASGQMDENKMYRVDRYDTDGDIRETDTIDAQLATARDTTLRVASRRGTLNYRSGKYNVVYPTIADSSVHPGERPLVHTNASGDFTLLSRKNWFEMGGYWETDSFSFHLDSILCYTAHFAGIVEEYLPSPMWIHHIEHDSGWTPDAKNIAALEQRLKLGGIPQISDKQLDRFVDTMAETSQPIKNPNIVNWGLAAEHLTEQVISMADWDSRDDPLRAAIYSPPLPSLPLHGERSCLSDTPDEIDGTDDHYVSFICSVCNDENDLGVTQKVQLLSDRLAKQCETFGLYAELLLVGWEPNFDGPGLTKSLTGPSGTNLDIHVITVPESDRRQLRIADTIRYFDFISNNVAACRASGKFLLFAPVETFFSDEFIQFLSLRRLNLNCLYGLCEKESNKDKIKIDNQSSKKELEKYFFSTANKISDGVFELISRASLTAFRGYPEVPATSEHISQILQCMAKAAGMRVIAFDRSIVLSASFKRKSEVPEDQSCPLLDYKTEIVPWCNLMKRDKLIINPNRDDWGFRNRQYKIYDVKSKTWLDEISNDVEVSPAALYTSGAVDDFQEMIDQTARSKNNPFFQEISARSLNGLKSIITAINPQKVIEFGPGTGLSIRTCLKADSELEVVAVGNNHTELKNSSQYLSIDFNRVRLIEKNPWKVRQTDLWNGRERVVLIFNLNILSDYGDVFEIFERLIPALKEHDLVVINGLWYSPIKLHERSVTSYFSTNVIQDINPLENKEFHFASYWETGSYLGAGDITNLVEWFNRCQVDVKSPSGTSLVQFKAFNGLQNYPPIGAQEAQPETGSFFYSPANSWVRALPPDEPLGQLINSHCEIGTENYKDGDFESAFDHFAEALMWGCISPERILLACEINLGKIREALELASNSFEPDRVNGEMLNKLRRFSIVTDDKYTVRQEKRYGNSPPAH